MKRRTKGFTLLEVMVAVAILAIALGAVFSAEAGSVRTAVRARKMGLATLLVRCKMGEIEEDLAKKGLPAIYASGSDKCCKDAEVEGFKCKWEVQPIVLPDTMFGKDDEDSEKPGLKGPGGSGLGSATGPGASDSKLGSGSGLGSMLGSAAALLGGKSDGKKDESGKDTKTSGGKDEKAGPTKADPKDMLSGDPTKFLSSGGGGDVDGITAMAMQFVYPVLKPAFQSQIRRATVTVSWPEGDGIKSFDVTQYVVAEQPVPLATDPNDPNALLGTTGTGLTGTGTSTGTTTTTPPPTGMMH